MLLVLLSTIIDLSKDVNVIFITEIIKWFILLQKVIVSLYGFSTFFLIVVTSYCSAP
nr:MAG TPA: hypothetical protein [Caudoviricetes sp.]